MSPISSSDIIGKLSRTSVWSMVSHAEGRFNKLLSFSSWNERKTIFSAEKFVEALPFRSYSSLWWETSSLFPLRRLLVWKRRSVDDSSWSTHKRWRDRLPSTSKTSCERCWRSTWILWCVDSLLPQSIEPWWRIWIHSTLVWWTDVGDRGKAAWRRLSQGFASHR